MLTEAKFHLVIGTVEIDYMQKELIRYQIRNKTLSPLVRMALKTAVWYKNKLDKLVPNNCNNNWTSYIISGRKDQYLIITIPGHGGPFPQPIRLTTVYTTYVLSTLASIRRE